MSDDESLPPGPGPTSPDSLGPTAASALPEPLGVQMNGPSATVSAIASYAHIDDDYDAKVLALVQQLRRDGIDAWSDHFIDFPNTGWPRWMRDQLRDRNWVLVFSSAPYKRRAEGLEEEGRGLGVIWEHGYIRSELYENARINERFVPVGFGPDQRQFVPPDLRDYTYFDLDSQTDYMKLLAVLKKSPLVKPEPLGRPEPQISNSGAERMHEPPQKSPVKSLPKASTVFFSRRFAQAFPGVRGIERFSQPTANERLAKLLEQPLSIPTENGEINPIWFWGRGDLYIHRFDVLPDGISLMDVYELDIEEVAAVNVGGYYKQFVYVKVRASRQSGAHSDRSYLAELEHEFGEATEECGFHEGRYITRAEFDDGAAVIDGKLVDVGDSATLRVRHLTDSNFIIAAQNAPISETSFDTTRVELLNDVLRGKRTLEQLVDVITRLPKRQPLRYEFE